MSFCDNCNRKAVVVYSSLRLCARHYGIHVAEAGLSANGLVWNRATRTFVLPSDEQRVQQAKARRHWSQRRGLAMNDATVAVQQPPASPPVPGMASLHPDEAKRLAQVAGGRV